MTPVRYVLGVALCVVATMPTAAAAREPTVADLAAIVLPKSELGAALPSLDFDNDSGPTLAAKVADVTYSRDDTAEQVRARGWIASYDLTYEVSGDLIGRTKKGLLTGIGSSVTLFADAAQASAFLDSELAALASAVGTVRDGARFESWEPFPVIAGDRAAAFAGRSSYRGIVFAGTAAYLQRGRLLLEVHVNGDEPAVAQGRVAELAARIDARVLGLLDGTGSPTPIKLPWERPARAPHLERFTVGPRGFGQAAYLSAERWSRADGEIATIKREVEGPRSARILGLKGGAFYAETTLYRKRSVPAQIIRGIAGRRASDIAVQTADILQSVLGGSVRATSARRLPVKISGVLATGYVVAASSDLGPVTYETILVSSGGLLGQISLVAGSTTSGRIDNKRFVALARAQAALLRRANKAGIGAPSRG